MDKPAPCATITMEEFQDDACRSRVTELAKQPGGVSVVRDGIVVLRLVIPSTDLFCCEAALRERAMETMNIDGADGKRELAFAMGVLDRSALAMLGTYQAMTAAAERLAKTVYAQNQRILELIERQRACPCIYTTPCHERCTCVAPLSSSGCHRCCSYGSEEQRHGAAERIANDLAAGSQKRRVSNALASFYEQRLSGPEHQDHDRDDGKEPSMSSPVKQPDGEVRIAPPAEGGVCCRRCEDKALESVDRVTAMMSRTFIVCTTCGNKRCPKATSHELTCTNSNATGQPGSDYE